VDTVELTRALARLRELLMAVRLPLRTPSAAEGERVRSELAGQIGDYLLPRLRQMDAPLLMVVGGSTGAGKSTLVNSLVGAEVSPAGVLRPTTRAPVLAFNPADERWFDDDRILPGLTRTSGGPAGPGGLQLVPTGRLPEGLALLDAPDIDSVVKANRALAGQLLAAADSWLFVTTAARYADAVPWDLLAAARERGTSLSLVLDRVPPEAIDEVAGHLRAMLDERGLGGTTVLVVPETTLADGRLPGAALAPVRGWLDELAADADARAGLVRRTLTGALDSVPGRAGTVRAALAEQSAAAAELGAAVERAYGDAHEEVDETVRSGALLRGEVLARWHDVVGTGDIMRASGGCATGCGSSSPALRPPRPSCARRSRRASTRSCSPRPVTPRSAPPRRGGARRRGGRCWRTPAGSTPRRPTSPRAPETRSATGRARCSSSSAPRGWASGRRRGSHRSASTARASRS
jgi:hypothetical protein